MPKVVITHNVVDVDNWLKGKSERAEAAARLGGRECGEPWRRTESDSVALTFDTHDVAGFMAAIADLPADLAAAMERRGVIPPLAVYVEK